MLRRRLFLLKIPLLLCYKALNPLNVFINAGRYVILMMSLFTLFTGFCYNDCFAKPLKFGPNYWVNQYKLEDIAKHEQLLLDPAGKTGTPYWFGKDPAWSVSYYNSILINIVRTRHIINNAGT